MYVVWVPYASERCVWRSTALTQNRLLIHSPQLVTHTCIHTYIRWYTSIYPRLVARSCWTGWTLRRDYSAPPRSGSLRCPSLPRGDSPPHPNRGKTGYIQYINIIGKYYLHIYLHTDTLHAYKYIQITSLLTYMHACTCVPQGMETYRNITMNSMKPPPYLLRPQR